MAKIPNFIMKIFGENKIGTDEIGKFGALAEGSRAMAINPTEVQELMNWSDGILASLIADGAPSAEDLNGIFLAITWAIGYIKQEGICEYHVDQEYHQHGICRSGENLYISLVNFNTGNAVTDTAYWKLLQLGGSASPSQPVQADILSGNIRMAWGSTKAFTESQFLNGRTKDANVNVSLQIPDDPTGYVNERLYFGIWMPSNLWMLFAALEGRPWAIHRGSFDATPIDLEVDGVVGQYIVTSSNSTLAFIRGSRIVFDFMLPELAGLGLSTAQINALVNGAIATHAALPNVHHAPPSVTTTDVRNVLGSTEGLLEVGYDDTTTDLTESGTTVAAIPLYPYFGARLESVEGKVDVSDANATYVLEIHDRNANSHITNIRETYTITPDTSGNFKVDFAIQDDVLASGEDDNNFGIAIKRTDGGGDITVPTISVTTRNVNTPGGTSIGIVETTDSIEYNPDDILIQGKVDFYTDSSLNVAPTNFHGTRTFPFRLRYSRLIPEATTGGGDTWEDVDSAMAINRLTNNYRQVTSSDSEYIASLPASIDISTALTGYDSVRLEDSNMTGIPEKHNSGSNPGTVGLHLTGRISGSCPTGPAATWPVILYKVIDIGTLMGFVSHTICGHTSVANNTLSLDAERMTEIIFNNGGTIEHWKYDDTVVATTGLTSVNAGFFGFTGDLPDTSTLATETFYASLNLRMNNTMTDFIIRIPEDRVISDFRFNQTEFYTGELVGDGAILIHSDDDYNYYHIKTETALTSETVRLQSRGRSGALQEKIVVKEDDLSSDLRDKINLGEILGDIKGSLIATTAALPVGTTPRSNATPINAAWTSENATEVTTAGNQLHIQRHTRWPGSFGILLQAEMDGSIVGELLVPWGGAGGFTIDPSNLDHITGLQTLRLSDTSFITVQSGNTSDGTFDGDWEIGLFSSGDAIPANIVVKAYQAVSSSTRIYNPNIIDTGYRFGPGGGTLQASSAVHFGIRIHGILDGLSIGRRIRKIRVQMGAVSVNDEFTIRVSQPSENFTGGYKPTISEFIAEKAISFDTAASQQHMVFEFDQPIDVGTSRGALLITISKTNGTGGIVGYHYRSVSSLGSPSFTINPSTGVARDMILDKGLMPIDPIALTFSDLGLNTELSPDQVGSRIALFNIEYDVYPIN